MNTYLIVSLALVAVGLFFAGRRLPRWQGAAEGLALNILAACLILSIQKVSEKPWNLKPILFGGASAILLMVPFAILQQRRQRAELNSAVMHAQTLREQLERSLIEKEASSKETKALPSAVAASGLTTYARNYLDDFQKVTGREFGDYIRSFVINSPPGSTFKVAGIDWTELFGAAVSATSERYLKLLVDPQTTFRVILLDPRSPVGLEKRVSEFKLLVDGQPRYVENHPDRVYGKILGSTKMMVEYHNKFPNQFQYRFVKELLTACWIMNGEQMVFYFYTRCHKGWDSPIFIADKVPNGLYEFFDQYFDFLWHNPNPCLSRQAWTDHKRELASVLTEFEQVLKEGCTGPLHQRCPKF